MVRVKFAREQQKQFIDYALQNLNSNLRELAGKLKISYELIKKCRQEVCSIDEKVFLKICNLVKINPRELDVTFLEDGWGQVKGGKIGILIMTEKYREKLRLWRARGGKNHLK